MRACIGIRNQKRTLEKLEVPHFTDAFQEAVRGHPIESAGDHVRPSSAEAFSPLAIPPLLRTTVVKIVVEGVTLVRWSWS